MAAVQSYTSHLLRWSRESDCYLAPTELLSPRLTSQLFLNVKSGCFPPRVSTLLMRAALKVTARQSWRREVELEVASRLLGQLFCHSDHQLRLLPVWSWHGHIFTHIPLLLSLLFQISRLYSICIQTFPCEYHTVSYVKLHLNYI